MLHRGNRSSVEEDRMRLIAKALVGAVLLVSASASAGVVIVPAASGHYVPQTIQGITATQNDWFTLSNNTVCGRSATERNWITPIVLPNMTGGLVDVYQRKFLGTTSIAKSNAYSATEDGDIYEWSGGKTNNSYLGDVVVPTNGTLFAESALQDSLDDIAGCVYQFRAVW
jgi:hypothetical protein